MLGFVPLLKTCTFRASPGWRHGVLTEDMNPVRLLSHTKSAISGKRTARTCPSKAIRLRRDKHANGGNVEKELYREERWQRKQEVRLQHPEGCRALCPYAYIRPELCKAALASLMIDKQYCSGKGYERCPIFLVITSKSERVKMCQT